MEDWIFALCGQSVDTAKSYERQKQFYILYIKKKNHCFLTNIMESNGLDAPLNTRITLVH